MNECKRCGKVNPAEIHTCTPKEVITKLQEEKPSEEFKFWYERFFLQSPSLCALQYDDEKMYEAWKIAYKMGLAEGAKLLEKDNQNDYVKTI